MCQVLDIKLNDIPLFEKNTISTTEQQPLQFSFNPEYPVRIDSALSHSLNL